MSDPVTCLDTRCFTQIPESFLGHHRLHRHKPFLPRSISSTDFSGKREGEEEEQEGLLLIMTFGCFILIFEIGPCYTAQTGLKFG